MPGSLRHLREREAGASGGTAGGPSLEVAMVPTRDGSITPSRTWEGMHWNKGSGQNQSGAGQDAEPCSTGHLRAPRSSGTAWLLVQISWERRPRDRDGKGSAWHDLEHRGCSKHCVPASQGSAQLIPTQASPESAL